MTFLLEAKGLEKRFGGLRATDGFDLAVEEGELRALIGPNGAGKSTAIGLLAGELRADAGEVWFGGESVGRWPVHRRVRAGLARSFQVTSVLPRFSAVENVMAVLVVGRGGVFGVWRDVRRDGVLRGAAEGVLAGVGLAARADVMAADLAHGEQRQLELGMALATGARMLLLDEPMAGLGPVESQAMTEVLRGLKGRVTMLLVEHDMEAVFALADRVTVLVAGRAIASGAAAEVRGDPLVRDAYLGEEA